MYSGYKFNFNTFNQKYYDIGNELYENDRSIIETDLNNFALSENTLDGNAIMESWFPQIKSEVFISHSHADERKVITLAGYLYDKFGLRSFIDSCIWHYSIDLLKEIDNRFCGNGRSGSYSYEKRNYSTSHVHMMLSISLMKMMDQTECMLFIDTPNSLNTEEIIDATNSPWIFSEISMSQNLRRKTIESHRSRFIMSMREATENFSNIAYKLDTLHLKEITLSIWKEWNDVFSREGGHGLDSLYSILPMEENDENLF